MYDVWHGPRGVPLDEAMAKSGSYDDEAELDKAKASWAPLEAAAVEYAQKQAEARAKAAAEKRKQTRRRRNKARRQHEMTRAQFLMA